MLLLWDKEVHHQKNNRGIILKRDFQILEVALRKKIVGKELDRQIYQRLPAKAKKILKLQPKRKIMVKYLNIYRDSTRKRKRTRPRKCWMKKTLNVHQVPEKCLKVKERICYRSWLGLNRNWKLNSINSQFQWKPLLYKKEEKKWKNNSVKLRLPSNYSAEIQST